MSKSEIKAMLTAFFVYTNLMPEDPVSKDIWHSISQFLDDAKGCNSMFARSRLLALTQAEKCPQRNKSECVEDIKTYVLEDLKMWYETFQRKMQKCTEC